MDQIKQKVRKFLFAYRALPSKKTYVEFLTALLSVPVLITVIILNVSSLRSNNKQEAQSAGKSEQIIVSLPPQENNSQSKEKTNPSPSQEACIKGIGDVNIDFPQEGDAITENPVIFTITNDEKNYCAVVWAYRINGGRYSEYDDKSIGLYNLPDGAVTFDLKVKSIVTGEEKVLTRKFSYKSSQATPTPTTTTATSSASGNYATPL